MLNKICDWLGFDELFSIAKAECREVKEAFFLFFVHQVFLENSSLNTGDVDWLQNIPYFLRLLCLSQESMLSDLIETLNLIKPRDTTLLFEECFLTWSLGGSLMMMMMMMVSRSPCVDSRICCWFLHLDMCHETCCVVVTCSAPLTLPGTSAAPPPRAARG